MKTWIRNALLLLRFIPIYLWEMTRSNLRVARDVLRPKPHFAPGFIEIDLKGYNAVQRWGVVCLITMTPGSLSIDIKDGSDKLELHALYMHDIEATRREMKTLIRRAFGKPQLTPQP